MEKEMMYMKASGLEILEKLGVKLTNGTAQKAVERAMNRAAKSVVSHIPKDLKSRYNIKTKASDLKKNFRITYADAIDGMNMTVAISVGKKEHSSYISDFKAKEKVTLRKGKKAYKGAFASVLIEKGVRHLRKGGQKAFIVRPSRGGQFVAVRKSNKPEDRKNLIKFSGPAFASMFKARSESIAEEWQRLFEARLPHEIKFAFKLD